MDLVEGKKNGRGVWKLESEAFKKPIEIKIWYDNKELAEFKKRIDDLEKNDILNKDKFIVLQKEHEKYDSIAMWYSRRMSDQWRVIWWLRNELEENKSEIKSLYKVIADLKTTVETLSGTIIHLQEQTSQISKKITKQPTIIHDKCFISGHESSGLWMINIPDGEYMLIAKYTVWEHNEFVTNQNDLIFEKIHVEGQHYVPFYKLEWGTELDTPTATIYYDLIFMPL